MPRREIVLKKAWFHILLALSESDLHGSGIAREAEKLSEGRIKLWPVSLYGSLQAMCDAELITELIGARRRPKGESEKKRYYRITQRGRRALMQEAHSMAYLAHKALAGGGLEGKST